MVQLKGAGPIHQGTSVPTRIVITNILKEISHDAIERPRAHLSWACQKQKLCAELPSVKKPRTFQKTSPPTTGKKNGQRVWEGQSQRRQVLCPSGSPHTGVQSESPAGAVSPALGSQSRCLQQSLARHLAPAYPLILERWVGGNQRSPWGMDTVVLVWTQVLAVPFGPPPAYWPRDPAPPSPTSLWAPGLRCHWPHGPTRQHTQRNHSHPWTEPCPPEGPGPWGPGPMHQCTGMPPGPCSQRPSPREQQGSFSLRASLTQQQADASPGPPQPCRLASRPAPVLGPAGPRVLPARK